MLKKTLVLSAATMLAANIAMAQQGAQYEVTITNLTVGQSFTPQMVLTYTGEASIFELGEPASEALEILAEGGNPGPLIDEFANVVWDSTTIGGLIGPGESASTIILGQSARGQISVAAMLIPTNDTFMALDGAELPRIGSATFMVPAYDAGTEANDQDCNNMPGPVCGGVGDDLTPGEGEEGYVHIGNGFHQLEEGNPDVLTPQRYDWRNPVARVTVTRIRN
ncbi:MAG: spondin domain-containing protein [Halioglobus sp.]